MAQSGVDPIRKWPDWPDCVYRLEKKKVGHA